MSKSTTLSRDTTETLTLSGRHLEYLDQVSFEMNPDMPLAFGAPHVIRMILDRFAQGDIDLTDASSEEEIAELGVSRLSGRRGRRESRLSSGRPSSSVATQRADRPANRSIPPVTGRCRTGRPPRSGHG